MELANGWRAKLAESRQTVTFSGQRGEQLSYAKLAAGDANKKPLKTWMEVEGQEVRLAVDDNDAVYPVTIDPLLTQQTKLIAPNIVGIEPGKYFGYSVAVSGQTVVVGAPIDEIGGKLNQGSAYVFVRSGTSWKQQQKLIASDGAFADLFGFSVAISGDTISYTLSYSNVGTANATGVNLTETVPVGTTFNAAASAPGWSCAPNGNAGSSCNYSLGSVSSGLVGGVSFAVTVNATLPSGVTQISTNRPPVVKNDSYSTNKGATLTVAAPGVLGNDTDADGNPLKAVLVSGPVSGALTLNANGSFTYTPAANFSGSVSFIYKANDGTADSNNATGDDQCRCRQHRAGRQS